jgi:hypothetical protein
MRRKGIVSAVENFASAPTRRPVQSGLVANHAISASMASGVPATVPLIPSGARMKVPRIFRAQQNSASSGFSASASGNETNL